jgi:hypothetical protein
MPASRSQRRPSSFSRAVVGELAGDHDLDRHQRELAVDAREGDQRLAELLAVLGVAQGELERVLRDADGAGGGLDAGALEGLHELLEALALDAAEQVRRRHAEAVEAELVLLHAAVAEHLDLAARSCRSAGKGSASVPRGFSASSIERPGSRRSRGRCARAWSSRRRARRG